MKRFVLVAFGPLAVVGTFIAGVAATVAAQPDPVATHWDLSGAPDGSFSLVGLVVLVTLIAAVAWLLLIAQMLRDRARELTVAPIAWGVMWFAVAVGAVILHANAGAADWRDAATVSVPMALLPVAAGALGAAGAVRLERDRRVRRDPGDAVSPAPAGVTIGLGAGERAVWSRRAQSAVSRAAALLVMPVLGGAALVAGGPEGLALGGLALVLVSAILVVSEVEVRIDARGLTLALGPFGTPRRHVPLAAISEVEHIDVDPLRWGGWGYRRVPGRPGTTAIVMHGGEALRVSTDAGRELVVTVADAGTAAALLSDLVRRRDEVVLA